MFNNFAADTRSASQVCTKRPTYGTKHGLGQPAYCIEEGGLMVTTLAVGLPAISGTAAAVHIPTMTVDGPPTISAKPRGQVTTVVYPGGDKGPEEVLREVEESNGGFKLGPHDGDEPAPEELEGHADAVRWRLVNNGVHGEVLGCSSMPRQQLKVPGSRRTITRQKYQR